MFDMIGNIFKNLTSSPATRKYPFEVRPTFKNTRGKVGGVGIDTCIFCGICSKKCPSDAIEVNKANKSWEIDPYKCVVCGMCAEVCPKKCIYMDEQYNSSAYSKEKIKFVQQAKEVEKAETKDE